MKRKAGVWIVLLVVLLTGCQASGKASDHLGEMYQLAYESMMDKGFLLNNKMEFIALDFTNLKVSKDDQEGIIEHLHNKYNVETMVATMDQLIQQGYYNPTTHTLDGVLLRLEAVEFQSEQLVSIAGYKLRSDEGAVGVRTVLEYGDEQWQIKDSSGTWVSEEEKGDFID